MSLSGQLNDLSLGELIEFFCNQRKTGRLKVDYALAPGVFFMKDGELVDAKVGTLNGAEAVYFALTLPSASFDFSAGVQSSRRTINERWPSVVLEGLRRIDEGLPAASADAFVGDDSLDQATLDYLNCVEESKHQQPTSQQQPPVSQQQQSASQPPQAAESKQQHSQAASASSQQHAAAGETGARADAHAGKSAAKAEKGGEKIEDGKEKIEEEFAGAAPLSLTVEASAASAGRRKMVFASVAGAVVIACAVAAVPVSRRLMRKSEAPAAPTQPAPAADAQPQPQSPAGFSTGEAASPEAAPSPDLAAEEAAAAAARREREARERARRLREEAARQADAAQSPDGTQPPAAQPAKPSTGPKTVRVQVTYDEAGRVTQASAVGTSPGAEAYASTAVRVARGRRFPAGKAGTTVVTIPIN